MALVEGASPPVFEQVNIYQDLLKEDPKGKVYNCQNWALYVFFTNVVFQMQFSQQNFPEKSFG